jgi:hypothetical protein
VNCVAVGPGFDGPRHDEIKVRLGRDLIQRFRGIEVPQRYSFLGECGLKRLWIGDANFLGVIAKRGSNKPSKVVALKRWRAVRGRKPDNGDEVWFLVFEFLGNLCSQVIQFRELSECLVTRKENGENEQETV